MNKTDAYLKDLQKNVDALNTLTINHGVEFSVERSGAETFTLKRKQFGIKMSIVTSADYFTIIRYIFGVMDGLLIMGVK